jgi:hypothetical protein
VGYIPPPKDLNAFGQNWLGDYGNFFHVAKKVFVETGDLLFCSPR